MPEELIEEPPIRLRRILFVTNFSRTSAKALPFAAAIARRFGAEIHVAHVLPAESYAHLPPGDLETGLREMKQTAVKRIENLLAEASFSDIRFRIVLEHGELTTAIASLVDKLDIDWIVIESHGRHGIQKLFSPAPGEAIARASACPVLLVGPEVAIDPLAEVRLQRILFATDFSPESRRAMEYAYGLARSYRANLLIFHAAADVWKEPLSTRMAPEAFCRMRLRENGMAHDRPDIKAEYLVDFGPAEALTLRTAKERDAQLIVLAVPGASHPNLASHLPGPLAYNVASHALCPVLAVRKIDWPRGRNEAAHG